MTAFKVYKFGGSSVSTKETLKKVVDILKKDAQRKIIVVSAVGKSHKNDAKVTDLLVDFYNSKAGFDKIEKKFFELKDDDFTKRLLTETKKDLAQNFYYDNVLSKGEYITARILAEEFGCLFVDSKELFLFNAFGELKKKETYKRIKTLENVSRNVVVPGFYGIDEQGKIRLFSRGGGDVTGGVIADALNAEKYLNYTDVSGILSANPEIVNRPETIKEISYDALKTLARLGVCAIHTDVFKYLKNAELEIRNTFEPNGKYTRVVKDTREKSVLITGGENVVEIDISCDGDEQDVLSRATAVLFKSGAETLNADCMPYLVQLTVGNANEEIYSEIAETFSSGSVKIKKKIKLLHIAFMNERVESGKVFDILQQERINPVCSYSSKNVLTIATKEKDYERAVKKIYDSFFGMKHG